MSACLNCSNVFWNLSAILLASWNSSVIFSISSSVLPIALYTSSNAFFCCSIASLCFSRSSRRSLALPHLSANACSFFSASSSCLPYSLSSSVRFSNSALPLSSLYASVSSRTFSVASSYSLPTWSIIPFCSSIASLIASNRPSSLILSSVYAN